MHRVRVRKQPVCRAIGNRSDVISLDGFGWTRGIVTEHSCDWPDCRARATVHGKTRAAQVYLCPPHGIDVLSYRELAIHVGELSPPARRKYEQTRRALDALGIETECHTIGEWLRQSVE